MTYLSRLELNPRSLEAARDLGDLPQMHKTVMRGFPDTDRSSPRATFGVLHRVEAIGGRRQILVQSHVSPDWSGLPEGYLRSHEEKSIDEALDSVVERQVLRFLLVANPTKKVAPVDSGSAKGKQNSKRVELRTDDARHTWLAERAERSGFSLCGSGPHDGVRIDRLPLLGGKITVRAIRYEGRLAVTDPDAFRTVIREGLGPGRAYGCGLISVMRT